MFLVFSQFAGEALPVEQLQAQAARFFATTFEPLSIGPHVVEVRLQSERPLFRADCTIRMRPSTADDCQAAERAEARGRAFGMAALAARCGRVWELRDSTGTVRSDSGADLAMLTLSAVCASIALGPVLPPDQGTLFGVRGAIERRDAMVGR